MCDLCSERRIFASEFPPTPHGEQPAAVSKTRPQLHSNCAIPIFRPGARLLAPEIATFYTALLFLSLLMPLARPVRFLTFRLERWIQRGWAPHLALAAFASAVLSTASRSPRRRRVRIPPLRTARPARAWAIAR